MLELPNSDLAVEALASLPLAVGCLRCGKQRGVASDAYASRRFALLNSPIEVKRHTRRVMQYLAPRETDRILEVGCGRGYLAARIQALSPETHGVDANPESIANAVAPNLRTMVAERLDYPAASFDLVYSFHVLEHLVDPSAGLREMARVLKPGGRLLLVYPAEPVRGLFVVTTAVALWGNPFRARELHLHRLTPRRVRRFAEGSGLVEVGSTFDPLLTPQFITVFRKPVSEARAA